jgi:hypothetical protein
MFSVSRIAAAACLAAACSAPATSNTQAERAAETLPVGAKAERSGFWSVASAPESPPGPPMQRGPRSELTFYAQLAGVSNAEADKRMKAQERTRPEFERLMRTLRTKERGNYTDAELIHRPDWAYLIYFKRQPAATLAKYTKNPRFQARSAPYTDEELTRMSKPWLDRLNGERLTTGYAMNARRGTADIDMVVSAEEFGAIAKAKGWGRVPAFLTLTFGSAPVGPAVDPAVAPGIRIFAQGDRNLGATNQAALGGRIVLRDGCLLVVGHDGKEQLAYFAREVGLGRDPQNYLSLHRRNAERTHLGRVGEMYTWAGPIGIDERAPMVTQLRAECGNAPLMHVGIPESSNVFNARYVLPRGPVPPPPPPPRPPRAAEVPG